MGIAFGVQGGEGLEGLLQFAPNPVGWALVYMVAIAVLTLAVRIAFAIGVSVHARGRTPLLVGANVWVLAVLLFGLFGVATYWFVNVFARPASPPAKT